MPYVKVVDNNLLKTYDCRMTVKIFLKKNIIVKSFWIKYNIIFIYSKCVS